MGSSERILGGGWSARRCRRTASAVVLATHVAVSAPTTRAPWKGIARVAAAATLCACSLLAAPEPAWALEEAASLGTVRAVLSYEAVEGSVANNSTSLTIFREEHPLLSESLILSGQPETKPTSPEGGGNVQLRELEGKGEPAVLVELSNGGNICCRYTRVYSYQGSSNSYSALTFKWLGFSKPAWRELNHDGTVEAIDGDGRFRYRFACGGCSPYPILVWAFREGHFVNVTRDYPTIVSKQAAALRQQYVKQRGSRYFRDVRGVLAAYIADEYLLGNGAVGWRLVGDAARGGYLASYTFGEVNRFEPSPAAYQRELRSFLKRLHYA